MLVKVLGTAAGGGFPQWNCNCDGCRRARSGDPAAKPRTQASLAVSSDGKKWVLLNASPDLPFQIRSHPCLQPAPESGPRQSPISAVVISSGDIDCVAGLLSLREGQKFALYADGFIQKIFYENRIFRVLDKRFVVFSALMEGRATPLLDAENLPLGLTVEAFYVPGKIPLYHETTDDITKLRADDAVIGLCVSDGSGRAFYVPGCGAVTDGLRARLRPQDVLFFDGTLWRDDEMILAGTGTKTGERMGHISISGAQGSLAAFANVAVARKIFVHINNTNPILCDDSAQAAIVREAGWEIGYDGMDVSL